MEQQFDNIPQHIQEVYVRIGYNEWMQALRVHAGYTIRDCSHDEELIQRDKDSNIKTTWQSVFVLVRY